MTETNDAVVDALGEEPEPTDLSSSLPPPTAPSQGELLVGLSFNPSGDMQVHLAKMRAAALIDKLANLPLRVIERDGQRYLDANHRMIVEEAIKQQVSATMWAVKALTWQNQ